MTDPQQKKEKGEVEKKSFGMVKVNREMIEIGKVNPLRFQEGFNFFMAQNEK